MAGCGGRAETTTPLLSRQHGHGPGHRLAHRQPPGRRVTELFAQDDDAGGRSIARLRAAGRAGLYCPSTAMRWLLLLSRKKNIKGTVPSPPISSSSTSTPRFFNSAWSARGSNDTKAIPVMRPG